MTFSQRDNMDIVADIKTFMKDELRIGNAAALDPEVPLVQQGVLDSIELVQLVQFLETRYGIAVDDTEVVPGNFRTLSRIVAFVEQKTSTDADAANPA